MDSARVCSKCKQSFPATPEFFNRNKATKDGCYHRCRKCNSTAKLKQLMLPGMKQCTECKNILPFDQFFADHRTKRDGLYPCCKDCFSMRGKKSRDKDVVKTRASGLASYYRNHASRLEYGRKYRQENPDKWKNKNTQWAKNNPEKARARTMRRIAKKAGAEGIYTGEDVIRLKVVQDGRCGYCGIMLYDDYHVDHFIPLSKNGSNWPGNLVIACATCNCSKSDKLFDQWQKGRGW